MTLKLTLAICAGAATLTAAAPCARAQTLANGFSLSPFWTWKTLETEHFRVSFDEPTEPAARQFAAYLEEAHARLVPLLKWEPTIKTQVLVLDNSDNANGATAASERVGMILYATPPETYFSTSYADNWMRILAFHEYSHFLNMDPTESWMEALRYVFGDQLRPNSLWPSWMLEGLAVYVETRYTRSGRGRSPLYEAYLRQAVAENKLDDDSWLTIDRLTGEYPGHPAGETPYFFGYQLFSEMARAFSDDAIGELSIQSASRVPFFINGNLENRTDGTSFYDLWDAFVKRSRARMRPQIETLSAAGLTRFEELGDPALALLGNRVSPDGRYQAFTRETADKRSSLYLRDLKTGRLRRVEDKNFGAGLAFTPDSKYLLYSSVEQTAQFNQYSELKIYDVERGRLQRLSGTRRFKDPTLSKDGHTVAFTLNRDARTVLATATLDWDRYEIGHFKLKGAQELFDPGERAAVSLPRFDPEGSSLVFSVRRPGETGEDLMKAALEERRIETLVSNGARNRFPVFKPDGALCWISDFTRVDNLYCASPERAAAPTDAETPEAPGAPELWTNVLGGIWFPEFAPDGTLYASALKSEGWVSVRATLPEEPYDAETLRVPGPSIESLDAPEEPGVGKIPGGTPAVSSEAHPYSVFPSIWPRAWSPVISFDRQKLYLGAEVRGYDATDRHSYRLLGAYDEYTGEIEWKAAYRNQTLGPNLTLENRGENFGYYRTPSGTSKVARLYRTKLEASFPFRWTWQYFTPSLALLHDTIRFQSDFEPLRSASLEARFFYTNAETSKLAVSVEDGSALELGVRHGIQGGSQSRLFASAKQYYKVAPHSVLVPRLEGFMSSQTARAVSGRRLALLDSIGDATTSDLDGLTLRGYPVSSFGARSAALSGLEFRFPLMRPFRGLGTAPFFFQQIYGVVFGEGAYFPAARAWLPAYGGALRLYFTALVKIPFTLSLEYHQGTNRRLGGVGEVFGMLYLGELAL